MQHLVQRYGAATTKKDRFAVLGGDEPLKLLLWRQDDNRIEQAQHFAAGAAPPLGGYMARCDEFAVAVDPCSRASPVVPPGDPALGTEQGFALARHGQPPRPCR